MSVNTDARVAVLEERSRMQEAKIAELERFKVEHERHVNLTAEQVIKLIKSSPELWKVRLLMWMLGLIAAGMLTAVGGWIWFKFAGHLPNK